MEAEDGVSPDDQRLQVYAWEFSQEHKS